MTVTFGYADPAQQAMMLVDKPRVDAYARAIREVVRPGDVVVDIGAGSGILAILAAKAGAKKVYAVERTGMIELIRVHARENGVGDVVVPLRKDLMDLEGFDEAPRVVLGEQLGHFAPDEAQHHLYARAKLLARDDAVFIPSSYKMLFAAAAPRTLDAEFKQLSTIDGVTLNGLVARLRARVSRFALESTDLLGEETASDAIPCESPLPSTFGARVVIARAGPVAGISIAFAAQLSPSVELSTSPCAPQTHWGQMFFPVHPPIDAVPGDVLDVEIRPRIVTDRGTYAWTVKNGDVVRKGDAMKSLVGDLEDTAAQLGLRVKDDDEQFAVSRRLRAWAAALGGSVAEDLDTAAMAKCIVDVDGASYPDLSAALQEVRSLLLAAGALRARA